jgi:hypothetical protein
MSMKCSKPGLMIPRVGLFIDSNRINTLDSINRMYIYRRPCGEIFSTS